MLMTRLKATAAFLAVFGLLALGSGILVHRALADAPAVPRASAEQQPRPKADEPADAAKTREPKAGVTASGALESVDAAKSTVTITVNNRQTGKSEKTYELAKDLVVLRDGKPARLADLKKGARITLQLSADQKTAVGLTVNGSTMQTPLKSVDADKNTVTITTETRQGKQDKTYQLAKDAKVLLEGKEARLADLKTGVPLRLTFSAEDANTVVRIETPSRRGGQDED